MNKSSTTIPKLRFHEFRGERQRKGVMFDTNIFNRILDGNIAASEVHRLDVPVFVTHVQHDELLATKSEERKKLLLQVFGNILQGQIPTETFVIGMSRIGMAKIPSPVLATESAVWDVSKWDQAKWPSENYLYESLKRILDERNGSKPNNKQDALIAETAIRNGLTLVTTDADLRKVVIELGGRASDWDEVLA